MEELLGTAAKRRAGGGKNREGCWTQHGAQTNLGKWGKNPRNIFLTEIRAAGEEQ